MLGLLLRSNARVIEAFRITAESTPNSAYRREFLIIAEEIEKGDKISSHLAKSPNLFPEMVPQMIAVGERTGNLSTAFLHLAQLYENEVDNMTKNLANSLEPVLMIFMGLVVGFVAFSIITPIYEFTKSIHK
jgi:type IV pilus assembly protein PilC